MKTDSELETHYKLAQGPDGTVWVSIQPLMQDIQAVLERMKTLDLSALTTPDDQADYGLQVVALQSVYQFLGSLLTEQHLKNIKQQQANNPNNPEIWH